MNEEQEKYFLDKFIEYDWNVCKLKKIIDNFISQAKQEEAKRIIDNIELFWVYDNENMFHIHRNSIERLKTNTE